ncbi:MAG: glycosyltransferase family 2 protein [Solirubrobacterales bacterium]
MAQLISIVAPMYNESANLDAFYERVSSVMQSTGYDYEIICITDGSTDDTLPKLIEIHHRDSRLKVINLSRNFGKEIALTAGMDRAAGDAVIPIDADLQDPPEVIPRLIQEWKAGFDVVYATREIREGESWVKRLTAYLFYRLMKRSSPVPIPADTGDFRLMSRRAVNALIQLREQQRFMKGLFAWVGYKQTSVLYRREPRQKGTTRFNYRKLWNLAVEGITSFSFFPLRIASLLGFVVAMFSFGWAAFLVLLKLIHGNPLPGYSSLMVAILFLGGVQLISLGIIGEYLGRTYHESKGRPLYFVQDLYGLPGGEDSPDISRP